jgi:membrane fusion protein (multidrug efflux system)
MRRPVKTLMLVLALGSCLVLGLSKTRGDRIPSLNGVPPLNTGRIHAYLDYIGMRAKQTKGYVVGQFESYFHKHNEGEEAHHEDQKIVVTSPKGMDVTIKQEYVCQIRSQRHINVQALVGGYLEKIMVKEGQTVKQGDDMFHIKPILYKAKLDAEAAEARLAQLEYEYTQQLNKTKVGGQSVVSDREVLLLGAKRDHAEAKRKQAEAEYDFATIKAPFDGIIDKLHEREGSLINEGDVLTTLSDNSVMWVYFNVPEARYLEYMAERDQKTDSPPIELELANHSMFPQRASSVTIEAQFNNETGNIPFRADFENPKRILRHGQTGKVWISRPLKNAIVIPQRATFEILDKRYVWVVGEDDVAHQTLITIEHELEDVFVIKSGLNVNDKFVLEGVRQITDGKKVDDYEFCKPEEALKNQKFHAE